MLYEHIYLVTPYFFREKSASSSTANSPPPRAAASSPTNPTRTATAIATTDIIPYIRHSNNNKRPSNRKTIRITPDMAHRRIPETASETRVIHRRLIWVVVWVGRAV